MDAILWILLPGFVAVGSGLLAFYIMQSRMEVALARERETMAQARGTLEAEKNSLEQALRGAKESARREALDEFLADVHVEQRHYVKDNKLLFQNRKALVLQERIFFPQYPAFQLDRARDRAAGRRGRGQSRAQPHVLRGCGQRRTANPQWQSAVALIRTPPEVSEIKRSEHAGGGEPAFYP